MKSILLLIALFSLTAKAQFGSETTKKIDTIENNTATDITINPTNQVVIPYLTSGELLINYGTGLQSFANGTEDQIIAIVGGIPTYIDQPVSLPDQSGNNGKYLFTDGTDASWEVVETLPDQTGNAGKFLGTDGTNESWETVNTAVTLQDAYDEAGQPQITVDGTNLGLQIRDAAVSIADFLFEVSNNALDTFYFAVDSTWAYIQGQPIVVADDSALDGEFVVRDSTEPNGYKYTASLQGKLNPVTDIVDGVCTSTHTTNVTTTCKYSRLGDKAIIEWKNTYTGTTNTANLEFSMPDGLVIDAAKVSGTVSTVSIIGKGTAINDGGSSYPISVVYIDSSNVGARIANTTFTYTVNANRVTATTPVNPLSTSDSVVYSAILPIQNWTSGLDAAVQDIQLTAQTANEFPVRVESDGSVTSDVYNIITSCTGGGTITKVCTFDTSDFTFTAAPTVIQSSCNTAAAGGDVNASTYSISTTGFTVSTKTTNDGSVVNPVCIKIIKDKTQWNYSQVIAGTFENIDSTDLCQVIASSNDSNLISGGIEDIPWKTIEKDNCNSWSNAGNTGADTPDAYTANKDSMVAFNMVIYINAATDSEIASYINGVEYKRHGIQVGANRPKFNGRVPLEKDDVLTFRFINGRTLASGILGNVRHHISITELPDYEAIVKNLYQDSTTECETKILQASSSTVGALADLTFTGLVVGKKYSMSAQVSQAAGGFTYIQHDSINIAQRYSVAAGNISMATKFVATTTTAEVSQGNVNLVDGNGLLTSTHARLCKLPDTTILN